MGVSPGSRGHGRSAVERKRGPLAAPPEGPPATPAGPGGGLPRDRGGGTAGIRQERHQNQGRLFGSRRGQAHEPPQPHLLFTAAARQRRGGGHQGVGHQAQGRAVRPLLPTNQAAPLAGVPGRHRSRAGPPRNRYPGTGAPGPRHRDHADRLSPEGQGREPPGNRVRPVGIQGPPDGGPPGNAGAGTDGTAPPVGRAGPGPRPGRQGQARGPGAHRRCLPGALAVGGQSLRGRGGLQDGRSGQQRADPRAGHQPADLFAAGRADDQGTGEEAGHLVGAGAEPLAVHPRPLGHQEGPGPPAPVGLREEPQERDPPARGHQHTHGGRPLHGQEPAPAIRHDHRPAGGLDDRKRQLRRRSDGRRHLRPGHGRAPAGGRGHGPGRPGPRLRRRVRQDGGKRPGGHPRGDGAANGHHRQGGDPREPQRPVLGAGRRQPRLRAVRPDPEDPGEHRPARFAALAV
mmetsp:Transcript_7537/g.18213  ORF Transcript_7537/g.18213 Transcript_7537/m.18213 type:complete len:458 (-) Transcript_7537:1907-3280(-)